MSTSQLRGYSPSLHESISAQITAVLSGGGGRGREVTGKGGLPA